MKVLWIVNIILPEVASYLNSSVVVTSGWIASAAKGLRSQSDVRLAIACPYDGQVYRKVEINGQLFYLLPHNEDRRKYKQGLEQVWNKVHTDFSPDIIHIHGTEYPLALSYIRACGSSGVVISVQGLIGVCYRYYHLGISNKDILKNITLRDIIRRDSIFQQKSEFRRRSIFETEYLKTVKYVIGRTSWDHDHVKNINSSIRYFVCNETLRDTFYGKKWNYESCEKYSIFLSQAGYPIKGLHFVLQAMLIVLREFPNVKLYIAGRDITSSKTLKDKLCITGYGKYILNFIRKYALEEHVFFKGSLSEEQMCTQYLKSNVFICPSTIENSPNSLGEAQILGMPCIASYVGGIPDMISGDGSTGFLYRTEEVEMLASLICCVFRKGYIPYNEHSAELAQKRHDRVANLKQLMQSYEKIVKNDNG